MESWMMENWLSETYYSSSSQAVVVRALQGLVSNCSVGVQTARVVAVSTLDSGVLFLGTMTIIVHPRTR